MMITMSYQSSGGGPPLPKRTTSQRQPHVTTDRFNHTRAPPVRSNSADTPPPLPPHHPESKTLPRSKKNESDVPPRNHNAPESPSRTRRRNSEDSHPIQRRTFETKCKQVSCLILLLMRYVLVLIRGIAKYLRFLI